MALSETPVKVTFCDGTAVLVSRNSFLDVEVHSGKDKARRRARSAPAECRYEDFVDAEINEAKPFTRTLTDRTVSTDYRDFDSLVDTEFDRQTSQQSSFSFSEMQDSPTAGSDDTEELSLDHFPTVMIKNIPCRCSAGEVLRAVDSLGFAGTYDFFYLPMIPD
ncbi:ML5 [Symbiodinium sp. CCMP2592]|nr:ML5 [Symbiodinium sp. CCMP2592]